MPAHLKQCPSESSIPEAGCSSMAMESKAGESQRLPKPQAAMVGLLLIPGASVRAHIHAGFAVQKCPAHLDTRMSIFQDNTTRPLPAGADQGDMLSHPLSFYYLFFANSCKDEGPNYLSSWE